MMHIGLLMQCLNQLKMNKNKETLYSFAKYCAEHPEERFWQAVRNWSGFPFVLVCTLPEWDLDRMYDTFYFEGRNK